MAANIPSQPATPASEANKFFNWRNVTLIAKRELKSKIRQKATIVTTVILAVIIIGIGVVYKFVAHNNGSHNEKDYIGATPALMQIAQTYKTQDPNIAVMEVKDEKDAAAIINHGKKHPIFIIGGSIDKPTLYSDGSPSDKTLLKLQSAFTQFKINQLLVELHASDTQIKATQVTPQFDIKDVSTDTHAFGGVNFNPLSFFTAYGFNVILLFALIMGASSLSLGVLEEKSSRVVEIILATVKPSELLLGKIIGIGIIIIGQFVIYLCCSLVAVSLAGYNILTSINLGMIPLSLVYLLLGFLLYALLFGSFSALASRQEELSSVTGVLSMIMVIPFYLGIFLVPAKPNSLITQIISYIPGFSSFMMPARFAFQAPWYDHVIALALLLVALPFLAVLGGRMYSKSILQSRSKVKFSLDLFKK